MGSSDLAISSSDKKIRASVKAIRACDETMGVWDEAMDFLGNLIKTIETIPHAGPSIKQLLVRVF